MDVFYLVNHMSRFCEIWQLQQSKQCDSDRAEKDLWEHKLHFPKRCLRHWSTSPQISAVIKPSPKKKKENVLDISAQFAKLFLLVVMDFL